uniref:Terpene synthase 27a n=1 Tax=Tripterygium wilfordii TaxID=458696 RepID=A0A7M1C6D9_TRIWF|nr:terpene synthase 27a [Tripterygium wilfordii]
MAPMVVSLTISHFVIQTGSTALHYSALPETRTKHCHSSRPFASINSNSLQMNQRPLTDYRPAIWNPELIDSLNTPYSYQSHGTQLDKLRQDAKRLLASTSDPCLLLNHVESMQRLGIAYHFQEEIDYLLNTRIQPYSPDDHDLHTTALRFRILRDNNFPISSDVFGKFMSREGKFLDSLSRDVKGLLSLYEASFLGVDGEVILDEAKEFSSKNLRALLGRLESTSIDVAEQVKQSLQIPLFWRMPRVEARNFIDFYQKKDVKSSTLLELAKLDFNLVQSTYQQELKELSKWWENLGFKQKLSFTRDRLMQSYFSTTGITFKPQFSKARIAATKFINIVNTIDDIHDYYGSQDDLKLFDSAVKRWDLAAMEELPDYMKICYFAMYNLVNELAYDVLINQGIDVLPCLREAWTKFCGAAFVESQWCYTGYTPSMDDYLKNCWISIGVHGSLNFARAHQQGSRSPIANTPLHCLEDPLLYWSSVICRLNNDLATFQHESKTGEVVSFVKCYMVEKGVSQEQACDEIRELIKHAWKMLNTERRRSDLPPLMVEMCMDTPKLSQCLYQHGDGFGVAIDLTKDVMSSLIFRQIPI